MHACAPFGESHATTLSAYHALALVSARLGRTAEAEPVFLECLDGRRALLGDGDPDTLATLEELARLYAGESRWGIGSSDCVLARRPSMGVMVSPVRTQRRGRYPS